MLELVGRGEAGNSVSVPVVLEHEAVLKRRGMAPARSAEAIDQVVEGLRALARHRTRFSPSRPQRGDPADDAALELSVAASVSLTL
jgi:hypothetical protein